MMHTSTKLLFIAHKNIYCCTVSNLLFSKGNQMFPSFLAKHIKVDLRVGLKVNICSGITFSKTKTNLHALQPFLLQIIAILWLLCERRKNYDKFALCRPVMFGSQRTGVQIKQATGQSVEQWSVASSHEWCWNNDLWREIYFMVSLKSLHIGSTEYRGTQGALQFTEIIFNSWANATKMLLRWNITVTQHDFKDRRHLICI